MGNSWEEWDCNMCSLYMHGRLGRGLFSCFSIDVCSGGKYKQAENVACTSQLCSWLPPSMQKVEYAPTLLHQLSLTEKKRKSMYDGMMEVLKCANLQLHQPLAPQFPRHQSQLKMDSMTCTDNWKVLEESQYCCQSCLGTVTSLCQNVKLKLSHLPYHLYLIWSCHILNC